MIINYYVDRVMEEFMNWLGLLIFLVIGKLWWNIFYIDSKLEILVKEEVDECDGKY